MSAATTWSATSASRGMRPTCNNHCASIQSHGVIDILAIKGGKQHNFSLFDEAFQHRLADVEDDRDVRNLIFNRLHIDASVSDADLQREVIELYGERYPDMTLNDWRHIVEAYTPMVREASRPKAQEVTMQPEQLPMAAEDMTSEE